MLTHCHQPISYEPLYASLGCFAPLGFALRARILLASLAYVLRSRSQEQQQCTGLTDGATALEVFPSSLQARYADLPASSAGLLSRFAPSGFALCARISLALLARVSRSRSPRAAAMYRLNQRCHSLEVFPSNVNPRTINSGLNGRYSYCFIFLLFKFVKVDRF